MAPRSAGALDAAGRRGDMAERLPESSGPGHVAVWAETGARRPRPVRGGSHSAAWFAERHPALFRMYGEVLSRLPALAQQAGDANAAIAIEIAAVLREFPPQDSRRLELLRATSYFLNPGDAASFAEAKERLSRVAIDGQGADTASAEQLDSAWGSSAERQGALMHTLPHWLAHVDEHGFEPLCERLCAQLADGSRPLLEEARRFKAAARDRDANGLPDGHDWLRQPCDILAHSRQSMVIEGGVNRLLLSQLVTLAADLPALKGHRHLLVRFIRDLLRGGALGHIEPAAASSDLRALLQALVRQLPHPEFGSGLTQNDILELAGKQLAGNAMHEDDRSQVLATLLPLIGSLSASTFSGHRDVQGEAIQMVASAMGHLSARHCAPLLFQMMDLCDEWSTIRRSAHGKYVPHTRQQVNEAIINQVIGIPVTIGESAVAAAAMWVAGRRSVQHKATQTIGATLERLMTVDAPADTALVLLPVCRRVLQGEDLAASGSRHLRNQVLAGLARGGLPFAGSAAQRSSFIELGLGRDPALRSEAARWFAKASLSKGPESDGVTRLAAARYLHHLLEGGGLMLSEQETGAAREAVLTAFRTTAIDHEATSVMLALLGELAQAGAGQAGAAGADSAKQALVHVLSSGLMMSFCQIDPHEVARVVPHIVSAYGGMSNGDRDRVDTQMLRRLGGPIVDGGPGARPQLPGLSFIGSLSRYGADDSARLLSMADEVWLRLNRANQQAALQQMFDAVDTASPAGLVAAIRFIARRSDDGDFVSGAVQMVRQMLVGSEAVNPPDSGPCALAVEVLCERLPRLGPSRVSELIANAVDGVAEPKLPVALWQGFIHHAARLDIPALRGLLSAWCNSLPTQTPEEAAQLHDAWQRVRPRLGEPAADTVDAFLHLAAESAPQLRLPRPRRPVSAAAAGELASALPRMDVASMQTALRHIRQADLPGGLRGDVTRNVLEQYPRIRADLRPTALALCFSSDPVRTLHVLSDRVGRRELQAGKVVWSTLDEAIPSIAGSRTDLRRELLQRPADEVRPALEALAERYAAAMPKVHRQAIAQVLARRLPELSPARHQRVIDTLVLANPELSDEEIRVLGGDPTDAAWAAPRQVPPDQAHERLKALQESRWGEEGAGIH